MKGIFYRTKFLLQMSFKLCTVYSHSSMLAKFCVLYPLSALKSWTLGNDHQSAPVTTIPQQTVIPKASLESQHLNNYYF